MKEIIDKGPRTKLIGHLDGAVAHFEEQEDVEPLLKTAHILSEDPPEGEWWKLAAKIPATVFNEACREGWLNDPQAWKRWANDPDNDRFRVWRGRL